MTAKSYATGSLPKKKESVRQLILSETARALNEGGPERTSLIGVMSRVGRTHGGFYLHFKSKEDLVHSAIDHMLKISRERLNSFVVGVPAEEALNNYLKFYLSMRHVADFNSGCCLPSLANDVGRMSPEAKKRVMTGVSAVKHVIATLLEKIGLNSTSAAVTAHSIFVEMIGAVTLARAADIPEQAREMLAQSLASIQQRIKP